VPTGDPKNFQSKTTTELRDLFDEQLDQMETELEILVKYNLISKENAQLTREQYDTFYIQDRLAYKKETLLLQSQPKPSHTEDIYVVQDQKLPRNYKQFHIPSDSEEEDDEIDDEPRSKKPAQNIIGISKAKIREITGYSYTVQMPWHHSPTTVQWQKELIEATENMIVVDGSRQ
jgi:hypothetical protein